ncbi:MAG: hypothetical protein GWN86_17385, partial [Desulfobacterales bacterium]|nr:hypothetical protein [Desulfobacterales bacterium]
FRCMHTLKGMSGLYGYQGMSEVSHALESLLDDIRLGKAPIDEKVLTFLLQMIDMLRSYVRDLKDGRADKEKDLSSELKQIEEFRLGSRSKEE